MGVLANDQKGVVFTQCYESSLLIVLYLPGRYYQLLWVTVHNVCMAYMWHV